MKKTINKNSFSLSKPMVFFSLAVILLWLKTYAAYQIEFDLGIDNMMQKFLLFINPISSAVLFLAFALFAKGRKSFILMIVIDFLLSFLLYANIVYYRFFTDFITLPTLTQTDNAGDLGKSIGALLQPYDFIYFLDTVILIVLLLSKYVKPEPVKMTSRQVGSVFLTAVILFTVNLGLAETDRPQLLTRTFDRNYLVKYLGMYNYTIYDAVQSSKASTQRAMADSSDTTEVVNFTKSLYAEPNPQYFGKAQGKNVIYIHLESLQNFIIDYKLDGKEVTPYLNSLAHDQNTFYFDNFFHQTGQGKTSDAEFMLENSLFGLPQGSAFSMKGHNTYQAAPAILGQQGYTSAVFHGNKKSFWNRDEIYKALGFDQFFDSSYYDMNEEDVLNYGLKDKPFFKESIPLLETVKQPFYAKFITLSNHFPFPMNQEEATIEPHHTGDSSVDGYFQTARYLDESVKGFMDYLKKSGLYDNSVIIMYGDHYGISDNHNKAMSIVMNKEIGKFENAQLQRVPLFIHVPGVKGGVQHQYGGQVDLLPTVLHLLGIDTKQYVQMGTDLLSPRHNAVVPFRNGDFISKDVTAINDKYYNTTTGEEVEATAEIKREAELVEKKLQLSDKVLNEDLLRFYTPKGFKPVNPSDYDYNHRLGEEDEAVTTK
ncbi:LTA synthase family protein [Pseudobacillus wudalianchiensis]|uniref:Glycerol phosphate lipoteichoic acid synthase n=1 Tax=Pseudobacillus wudalianchiensis TaxID=1743143 RepID=A0A1B9B6W8_9BACI|nr:LTA synthase family protein [Bacillus wudalianchiensis]OCA91860.1 glycerol phosphate lipoteichoic acid synthase [Bacillus wudalianchiensis]